MARAGAGTYPRADRLLQSLVQHRAGGEAHEQYHAHVAVELLGDGQRFLHLADRLDLRVDFRRADANAARIQRGVRAAVNDEAGMRGRFREVAVAPHAGKALEVGSTVFRAVQVVEEAERHGGKGFRADEFPLLPRCRSRAVVAPDLDGKPQSRPLDFTGIDGPRRVSQHEAGHDVGAAGDGGEVQVRLDRVIDQAEACRHERRSRGKHDAQGDKVVGLARPQPGLVHGVDVFRRRAEMRHALRLRVVEQRLGRGVERRAVEEQQRRAAPQSRDQPVPHHPAQRREVEQPVALVHVGMQPVLLQMLEQHAAGAVDDAFRHARGAG